MTRSRLLRGAAVLAAAALATIQFVPVDRANPPVKSTVLAPPEVMDILEEACFDCHSHRTRWPWYSRLAPVSWWVAHHVRTGRGDLNFDAWPLFDPEEAELYLRDVEQQLLKGEMPPGYYKIAHPGAQLTAAEVDVLLAWSRGR